MKNIEKVGNQTVCVQDKITGRFSEVKTINLAVFGKGVVGGALLDQITTSFETVLKRRKLKLKVISIADSKGIKILKDGFSKNWKEEFSLNNKRYNFKEFIKFVKKNKFDNLIAIDNTASTSFVSKYLDLIENDFNLISSNKIANTLSFDRYQKLRKKLAIHNREYLYETNVGAGLPLIDTIRLLHDSGEDITKIRGVFSGSLSYLFNEFSEQDLRFSEVLGAAFKNGYTEPDPREDLCGNDVARKLVILARELDLANEVKEVFVENLIPTKLRDTSLDQFHNNLSVFDSIYSQKKDNLNKNEVLRYVGELGGDLFKEKGELSVKLIAVSKDTPLGALKGTDAIFEIYTASYGNQPIVIQGAGAGSEVTARGVFGDVLRIAKNLS